MKQITVTNDMASQRLDKYLQRLLPSCPKSLIYKQLRKKNITLNSSKATGNEIIKAGDVISVFFSDETYEKFSSGQEINTSIYEKAFSALNVYLVINCINDEYPLRLPNIPTADYWRDFKGLL